MDSPSSSLLRELPLSLFEFVDLVSLTLDPPGEPVPTPDAPEPDTARGRMRRALRKIKSRASAVVRGPLAATPVAPTPPSRSPAEYRIPELRLSVNNTLADGFMPYLPLVAQYERASRGHATDSSLRDSESSSSSGTPSASSCSSSTSTESDYPRTPPSTIFERRWSAPSSPKSTNPTFEHPFPPSLPFPKLAAASESTPDVHVCHAPSSSTPIRIRRHATSAPRRCGAVDAALAVRASPSLKPKAKARPTSTIPRRADSPDWSALLAAFPPPPTYMPPVPSTPPSGMSRPSWLAGTPSRHRRDFTLDLDLDPYSSMSSDESV